MYVCASCKLKNENEPKNKNVHFYQYITVESLSSATESVASATTAVPSFSENRSNPITMTFQTIEPSQLQLPPRSATPSHLNKPAPMIPHYQQNLVYDYCAAPSSQLFDPSRGTPSPRPDLCKSPAFGPPPNVLKIQAPRLKSSTDSLDLSTKLGSKMASAAANSCKVLAASCGGFQSHSKNVTVQPDTFYREQRGNTNIDVHTSGSQMNEAKKSATQSSATVQIGNTQIQRNRRVVEEFEHTQKASTTEIRTSTVGHGHGGNAIQLPMGGRNFAAIGAASAPSPATDPTNEYFTELSYGRGFVAEQARRLSEGHTQSNKNVVASYRFPQTITDPSDAQFPISNASSFVSFEPPKEQTYHVTTTTTSRTPSAKQPTVTNYLGCARPQQNTFAGAQQFPAAPQSLPPPSPSPQPQAKPQKISFPPPSPFELATVDDPFTNPSPIPLTKACLTKQLSSPYPNVVPPSPQSCALSPNPNNRSTFKPTSTNVCGNNNWNIKPTPITTTTTPSTTSNTTTIFNNQSTVSVSDPNPASAGAANKSGASSLGATFSPKRGRGVLNAGVAPGGRVPLCGCCSAQIR